MTQPLDRIDESNAILITQGEFATSDDPNVIIKTLLGSCVSCCLWDEVAQVGGMNHMLLAGKRVGNENLYDMAGVADMECLINAIIKLGGRRERLKAKVFGGAKMINSPNSIGAENAQFALDFLQQEEIECVGSSVGGRSARNIRFWPGSGRANMRLSANAAEELTPAPVKDPGNDLELF